ncbi:MAG: hypothetical protein J5842_01400 [Lachnospiraceae bacterium]|nr:hypothetical protein [Lachnospiraceae bacterium]
MKITTSEKSIRISLTSDELNYIAEELGFMNITEMVGGGLDDMILFIAEKIKEDEGIDIIEMTSDVAPISVMVINDMMLIEIPRDSDQAADIMERPEERFKDFMEHLRDAIIGEIDKQMGQGNRLEIKAGSGDQFLFRMESAGTALSALRWVKDGRLIRWKGELYIQTPDMTPGLVEHFEMIKSPSAMQPDDVICVIKRGRPIKRV